MSRQRRRRKGSRSLHLSITATDEEWEVVRRNAVRRRKSIARYLVGLSLGENSTAADSTGPEVALDPSEQREGLDILRRFDQYVGDEESSPLIVDLQARVAVIFDGWAIRNGCRGMFPGVAGYPGSRCRRGVRRYFHGVPGPGEAATETAGTAGIDGRLGNMTTPTIAMAGAQHATGLSADSDTCTVVSYECNGVREYTL